MNTETPKIVYTIELSLAYVKYGGNTGTQGQYFYSYNPKTIFIPLESTLVYSLAESTSDRFEIVEFLSSDGNKQFSSPIFSNKNRSLAVENKNTNRELINVTLIIKDNKAEQDMYFNCDPQVLNSPGTLGGD